MCIITLQPLNKPIAVDDEIYSCDILGDIRPNCPFVLIGDHLWKLTNVTFMNLLCFIMLKSFKKSLQPIVMYKVEYFCAKLEWNCPFAPQKDIFGKND